MTSCLVPDLPAVLVALEHLKELDKQLKEDGITFSLEASLHQTEITAAITELEPYRRAAHEHLEVETIENSKLRHQINNIRERMSQEIMADVAAARTSNAEEMEQLQQDFIIVSQLREATVTRQEVLLGQNEELYREREQVMAEHKEVVAALNDQITLKYGLQMHMDQTQEQTEKLKSSIATAEQDKITLQHDIVLEREAFAVKQESLHREVDQVEGKVKQQKQVIKRSRRELDRVNNKKKEAHDHLGKLTIPMAKLQNNLQRLAASRCQCEQKLEGETQKHQGLRQQRETLNKELCELGEAFSVSVQRLKEEIATVEDKIEEGRATRLLCQDTLAQNHEIFNRQNDEENEVRAENFTVSQQLERSRLKLEERITSIVKHSKEIKEMNRQMTELLEANTINKRIFEKNQEEMCSNVNAEKSNIHRFEEEKRRLTVLLEEAKRKQKQHVAKMTSDISSTRRRYQELQQEEAALQQQHPTSIDADLLISHVTQCEMEYRQKETKHHQEIEQCIAETESIMRSNDEKQREVEEKEERLREVEATWSEEQVRHERLKSVMSELWRKENDLKMSIHGLIEKTSLLLQPKDVMKAELAEMRDGHMDMLSKQASELRAAEMSIYDSRVKLEQVSMENSRLHLCIQQMTEGVSRAREDKDRYWQEIQRFRQDTQALFKSLQEAWREDIMVTRDCQSNDGVLLLSMSATLNRLRTRRQHLGNVSTLLHRQMLDFSRRLGDKTAAQHSVPADL
uniref:coiled-coil domain-containing protein 175 n=1 Tax=Scatophagus argus TaxID=75038 RepID=UPI001ED7F97D|nr:coiled-coil domain-containing protein 175 [Scatophagus argus]